MYEAFYGLSEKPFSLVPDPDYLFLGRLHSAALNMLEYGLRGQASFTLITGEVGCGKTVLVRKFLQTIDSRTTVRMITNTPRSKGHILERILLAFKLDYRGKSEVEQYETIIDFLEEQQGRGQHTILIIDEAHNLDEDSLEELRMLSNINVDKSLALQIILVGQPEILDLLNTASLRQLTQRISVNFRLLPLVYSETRRYIRHRLRVAGGSPDIFEPRAIAVIHLLSGGIPRLINILCDAALVYGFGEDRNTLGADLIQEVASDMLLGGLATLPAIDRDFDREKMLESADKLVASLDPDDLDDEVVELPPLPSLHPANPANPATTSGDSGDETRAGKGLGTPRAVTPIFDTPETDRDGAGRRRIILIAAIISIFAVVGGGLLWFFWPSVERMQASPSDVLASPGGEPPAGQERSSATLGDLRGRSGDGAEQFGAALAGLFGLWNKELPAIAGAAPCSKASGAGLSCYEREANLDRLIRLDRPAIIGIRKADRGIAYALLVGQEDNMVRLLAGNYEVMAARDEVNSVMAGPFLLLWKPPPGYRGLLAEGQRGETVAWLRAELGKVLGDEVNVGSGDRFDATLARAVREFQERNGLKVDGIAGVETLIKLNSASLGDEVPRLD